MAKKKHLINKNKNKLVFWIGGLIILLAVVIVLVISLNSPKNRLIGTWSFNTESFLTGDVQGTMTFTKDGKFIVNSGGETGIGDYTILDKNTLLITPDGKVTTLSLNFYFNGNYLYLTPTSNALGEQQTARLQRVK